jgi:hypothetical protein
MDIRITDHGSLVLFTPVTQTAEAWIAAHVDSGAQWWGRGVAVDHRLARDLAQGMAEDGLILHVGHYGQYDDN